MLTESKIAQVAGLRSSYHKGCQYFFEGRIKQIDYHPATNSFNAVVQGKYDYEVSVYFDEKNEIDWSDCECPAFHEYSGACKHVVAVLKSIQRNWANYFGGVATTRLHAPVRNLLDFFERDAQGPSNGNNKVMLPEAHLVPTLFVSTRTGQRTSWVEFSIGRDRRYVLKDVRKFMEAYASGGQVVFGQKYTYRPLEDRFDHRSQQLLELMQVADVDEKTFLATWGNTYQSRAFHDRRFNLSNTQLLRFLEIMGDESFDMTINSGLHKTVHITETRPHLTFDVSPMSSGLKLSMVLGDESCYGLDSDFKYVYYAGRIHRVDEIFSRYLRPTLEC